MRALTVIPQTPGSLAVSEVPDPVPGPGELLVEGVAIGICGTDAEIAGGGYGWAPEGRERLVLGHESLGRVVTAPPGSGFAPGDLVVGVVRRPDPVPCGACARGEFDMCVNGRYEERGIRRRDGYGSERWTVEAAYAVRLDPRLGASGVLLEPTTVVAKAWEQIERIGRRAYFAPRRVLVTGAGPIGLLAALLARQRGLDVQVVDRVAAGPKPDRVAALGAAYRTDGVASAAAAAPPDVVIEATGAPSVVFDAIEHVAPGGIVCLTGISPEGRSITIDGGMVDREVVLGNGVVVGSVNANLGHYRQAARALARADPAWLAGLVTRRVPLAAAADAVERRPDDVKVVVDLSSTG